MFLTLISEAKYHDFHKISIYGPLCNHNKKAFSRIRCNHRRDARNQETNICCDTVSVWRNFSQIKIFNRKDLKTFCEFIHPPAEDISQLPTEIPRLLTNPTLDAYKSLASAPTTGWDWDKNDNHFGQFWASTSFWCFCNCFGRIISGRTQTCGRCEGASVAVFTFFEGRFLNLPLLHQFMNRSYPDSNGQLLLKHFCNFLKHLISEFVLTLPWQRKVSVWRTSNGQQAGTTKEFKAILAKLYNSMYRNVDKRRNITYNGHGTSIGHQLGATKESETRNNSNIQSLEEYEYEA